MSEFRQKSFAMTFCVFMLAVTFISGCATIINGTTQKIPVSSTPSGAKVTVNESTAFTTPTSLELSRKEPQLLQFSLDGYFPENVKLESVTSGAVMGNILLGGLIGWGVDAASGAQNRLVPESVHIALRPINSTVRNEELSRPSRLKRPWRAG